jgi:hypothetical protein
VHFKAPEFGQWMLANDRAAMLHFVYNANIVSVLVCHDMQQGEFVVQVPFVPPVESIGDYDRSRCL